MTPNHPFNGIEWPRPLINLSVLARNISPVDGECLLLLWPEAPGPLLLLLGGGGGGGGGPEGGGAGGGEAQQLGGSVHCHYVYVCILLKLADWFQIVLLTLMWTFLDYSLINTSPRDLEWRPRKICYFTKIKSCNPVSFVTWWRSDRHSLQLQLTVTKLSTWPEPMSSLMLILVKPNEKCFKRWNESEFKVVCVL